MMYLFNGVRCTLSAPNCTKTQRNVYVTRTDGQSATHVLAIAKVDALSYESKVLKIYVVRA